MTEIEPHPLVTKNYGSITYHPNIQHRDNNPNKSQWLIDIKSEINVFLWMDHYGWGNTEVGWGLCIIDIETKQLSYLGETPNRNKVFFAKFVTDPNHNTWHGYPADYQINRHDVPDALVLRKWIEQKFLTKPKIRKIASMQPCEI